MFKFNRKTFFDKYRETFGKLSKKQVSGLEFLLGAIENDPEWKLIEEIAYVLSTTDHETAHTFQPITEYRARAGTKARANQDRYWEPYRGRGFVQITWKRNYQKFGIADEPEKALEPETAYRILSEGMRKGSFTGKKLSDFINDREVDYHEARTVVNGHDKAQLLAANAQKFERILRASLVTDSVADHSPQPEVEEPKAEPPAPSPPAEPKKEEGTTPPEGITVQKVVQSLGSKVLAGGTLVMGALTALGGAFLGVIKNPYAFAILIIGCAALGVYAWNKSKDRQLQLQLDLNSKASAKDQHTIVLKPPEVEMQ